MKLHTLCRSSLFSLNIAYLALTSQISLAGPLISPFPSTVQGLSIHNSHAIERKHDGTPRVVRGMAPLDVSDAEELAKIKITDVLIFRDNRAGGASQEMDLLKQVGIVRVQQIPFKWKDIRDFKESCLQMVQALTIIRDVATSEDDRAIFFHCTVGEDRTGALAGLYRMLREGRPTDDVFRNEMCLNGYEAGDPRKAFEPVVLPIRETLTPFFLKMAYKIERGDLSWTSLDPQQCDSDPVDTEDFKASPEGDSSKFVCTGSPRYQPE